MNTDDDLDRELERLLFGDSHSLHQEFERQPRRYSRDGLAQGLLINRMEALGFRHQFLPSLPLFDADGNELAGHRFVDGEGTAFEVYAASDGVALVTAAHKAITAKKATACFAGDGDDHEMI